MIHCVTKIVLIQHCMTIINISSLFLHLSFPSVLLLTNSIQYISAAHSWSRNSWHWFILDIKWKKILRNIFLRTWLKNVKISEIQHLYLLFNVKIEMVHMSKKKKLFRLCLSWILVLFVCNLKHWEIFLLNQWFF